MDDMEIRCSNPIYMEHFEAYLSHLFDEIRDLLFTNGGPIIMLQCENEYGYYGDDKQYLNYLKEGFEKRGIDVPLFTSDGTSESDILDGSIDGLGLGPIADKDATLKLIAAKGGLTSDANGNVYWANGWSKDNYAEKLKEPVSGLGIDILMNGLFK